MKQSSRAAAGACYLLAALLTAAAIFAWWSPRRSPLPWFAPAILAVVAATFASTFRDADLHEEKLRGLKEGEIETRSALGSPGEPQQELDEQQQ